MRRKFLSLVLACLILSFNQITAQASEANRGGENIGYVCFHKVPYRARFATYPPEQYGGRKLCLVTKMKDGSYFAYYK